MLGHSKSARESPRPLHEHVLSASDIPVRLALFVLRFYKTYLSIIVGGTCRFEPTCSRYAYEAIERFGAMRGAWLALRRLLRCQPLSRKFGYDPVPEAPAREASSTESAAGIFHRHSRTHKEAHS